MFNNKECIYHIINYAYANMVLNMSEGEF